jgi:RNA 2',3'-cyclic 3'-phosphodiesterase
MQRLFVGIRLETHLPIIELQQKLRESLKESDINWVDPAGYHITLKFLGDIESYYIESIKSLLQHISTKYHPFHLHYNHLGYFGTLSQPKVIWYDFEKSNELIELQQSVDKALGELGFEIEDKNFKPHLTFGRIKKLKNENVFRSIMQSNTSVSGFKEVTGFELIESNLKPTGPIYTTIAEFNLNKNLNS